ncbi:MAG: PKD domain-containing protein, partial [Bacilli bacterium]
GYFRFPPLAPDVAYTIYARNATGATVSEIHTYALSRGQTVDLLLLVRDESLLPSGVDFTAAPTSGAAPLLVRFTATGGDVETWRWDFGDGATGAGQSSTHTYGAAGTFTVNLTAENYFGVREVVKVRLISVSGGGISVPAQVPARFVIQVYSGQRLDNVTVTATPLESTGPLAWLYDLFGISGEVDINGTILSGTTGTDGGIVFSMVRTVKYQIDVVDPSRGINTTITTYPHEDEVVISVWPVETPGPAGDFRLYAEEEAGGTRVGVRYAAAGVTRVTFTVKDEAGAVMYTRTSAAPDDDLSYLLDGEPGEVFTYSYAGEHPEYGEIQKDQFIRFEGETRPMVDLAPWIPRGVYHWASILLLFGFAMTFVRGEIRGALLTIPILAGTLWLIGWLEVPWLVIGGAMVLGIMVYMRMSEGELQI